MKNSSLDTSILLRLCTGDVPEQAEAATRLIEKHRVTATAIAFIEAEHVLRTAYQFSRDEIADMYAMLMSQANLICDRALLAKALHDYQKYPSESFVDCCLTASAELDEAVPLLTFDQNLAKHLPNARLLSA